MGNMGNMEPMYTMIAKPWCIPAVGSGVGYQYPPRDQPQQCTTG